VRIRYDISSNLFSLKSKIIASDLKNIISNLINNSAEAMDQNGFISVSLEKEDENLLLEIRDNGKGIPKEILPQLMQEGASFGKKDGNGLGLYHAKKSIESWGGQIQIRSTVGVGTTVSIKLPIV
jgi:signal transduction histidine kinase